ncbi:hypothetical protein CRUP_015050 [Coryphaenoides rupestris]|nr:hypothetical protein CRUP_015050 [Coryphaenoides rupestris]
MYTTERRRMSLHEVKRKDPVWVSGGSVWQDSPAPELCGAHGRAPLSPRGQNRALSVAYIVVEDASLPHSEENLSLKCLKEACADVRAVFKTISFERITLGTTDVLDSFYNAGNLMKGIEELLQPSFTLEPLLGPLVDRLVQLLDSVHIQSSQKYRKEWESVPEFKGWLKPVIGDDSRAYSSTSGESVRREIRTARERFSGAMLSQELARIQNRLDTVDLMTPDIIMNLLLSYRDVQVGLPWISALVVINT